MHDICVRVSFELSSSSWTLVLDSFGNLLECFIHRVPSQADTLPNAIECLVTLRFSLFIAVSVSLRIFLFTVF